MAVEPLQRSDRSEHNTYQYLRLGMMGALLTLAVSLGIEIGQNDGCIQKSISAYYFTEVQAVFVGTLLLLGVAMTVISGRLVVEDAFLNLAGLLAPIVAFAPTKQLDYCGLSEEERMTAQAVVAEAFNDGSVANNIWAYLVVVGVGLLLAAVVLRSTEARVIYWAAWLGAAAWWTLVAFTFINREALFTDRAHLVSAVTMLVFIFIVVCTNASDRAASGAPSNRGPLAWNEAWRYEVGRWWDHRRDHLPHAWRAARNRYGVIAVLMAVGVIAIAVYKGMRGFETWFFWIGVWLLALFAVFWAVQTWERFGDHEHIHERAEDPPLVHAADTGQGAQVGR